MHDEAAIGKCLEIVNNKLNIPMRLQLIICFKKELLNFFAFFYKTRANTQQMLPVQTGLHRSDE